MLTLRRGRNWPRRRKCTEYGLLGPRVVRLRALYSTPDFTLDGFTSQRCPFAGRRSATQFKFNLVLAVERVVVTFQHLSLLI